MFFDFILLGTVLFLLIFLSWIWPPDSPWAPWWRTNKKTAKAICKISNIKKSDVIYDLGCGDAELLIQAGKIGATGIGLEIEPSRFLIAKLRIIKNGLQEKIEIKRINFFKEDISKASVIVVYLVPKTLNRLLPKFKKELKKGTRIISFRYKIEGLSIKKIDKKNDLMLYVI